MCCGFAGLDLFKKGPYLEFPHQFRIRTRPLQVELILKYIFKNSCQKSLFKDKYNMYMCFIYLG